MGLPRNLTSFRVISSERVCSINVVNQASLGQNTPFLADLIFVIFFTRAKFLEDKIYTKKTRKLLQNTQKIANFLRYYGKIHSKLPIFRVKSVKIYTGQKNLHENSRGS